MFEKKPKYISSNAVGEHGTYFQKVILFKKNRQNK